MAMLVQNAEKTLEYGAFAHQVPNVVMAWSFDSVSFDVRLSAVNYLTRLAAHVTVDSGRRPSDVPLRDLGPALIGLYTAIQRDKNEDIRDNCRSLLFTLMATCSSSLEHVESIYRAEGEMVLVSALKKVAGADIVTRVTTRIGAIRRIEDPEISKVPSGLADKHHCRRSAGFRLICELRRLERQSRVWDCPIAYDSWPIQALRLSRTLTASVSCLPVSRTTRCTWVDVRVASRDASRARTRVQTVLHRTARAAGRGSHGLPI